MILHVHDGHLDTYHFVGPFISSNARRRRKGIFLTARATKRHVNEKKQKRKKETADTRSL